MKPTFNILLAASVTFLATTGAIHPCSCVEQSLAERLKRADAVFVGKVIHLEVIGQKAALDEPTVGVTVNVVEETVEVSQVAKGSPPETVTFTTTDGCCYCDYLFQIGKSYLIFATADEATGWQTYICSGTKPLAQAAEDLEALGLKGPEAVP